MSKIETNTIDTISGTTNLTIGSTNSSTVTFENGAVTGHMYPAFEAVLNADQSYTDNTATKVQFGRETFDTDNCYDNSTNYRFTPTVAGKYFVYSLVLIDVTDLTNKFYSAQVSIRKNGTNLKKIDNIFDFSASSGIDLFSSYVYGIVEFNGSSDYVEIYAKGNGDQNGNFRGNSSEDFTYFGAYRIGA
jgi:hypothetical protein